MGGKPDNTGLDLGSATVPNQLSGNTGGALGYLPMNSQSLGGVTSGVLRPMEQNYMANQPGTVTPDVQQQITNPENQGGVINPDPMAQTTPAGLPLYSVLNQFALANPNSPLAANILNNPLFQPGALFNRGKST